MDIQTIPASTGSEFMATSLRDEGSIPYCIQQSLLRLWEKEGVAGCQQMPLPAKRLSKHICGQSCILFWPMSQCTQCSSITLHFLLVSPILSSTLCACPEGLAFCAQSCHARPSFRTWTTKPTLRVLMRNQGRAGPFLVAGRLLYIRHIGPASGRAWPGRCVQKYDRVVLQGLMASLSQPLAVLGEQLAPQGRSQRCHTLCAFPKLRCAIVIC